MQESTAGHGPPKGYHGINDALKRYFRAKGTPHQKRMDNAFNRTKRVVSPEAIKKLRQARKAGSTIEQLVRESGISRARLIRLLGPCGVK